VTNAWKERLNFVGTTGGSPGLPNEVTVFGPVPEGLDGLDGTSCAATLARSVFDSRRTRLVELSPCHVGAGEDGAPHVGAGQVR
jgi:hypothetical protein